ncbi:MAG: sigma-54-dependent Fis family transcriptional regulator [Candidatus Marinimicrobia bacterium]|nr:sigma-54-dependent Fis family transcriptional regulator [Candidatus Neomarinimicrobiota bacterium]
MAILVIGLDKKDISRFRNICSGIPVDIRQTNNGYDALNAVHLTEFKILVISDSLPLINTIDTIKRLLKQKKKYFILPYFKIVSLVELEKYLSLGVENWLFKSESDEEIYGKLRNIINSDYCSSVVENHRFSLKKIFGVNNLVGSSGGMRNLFDSIERVADSNVSVLIQGESGSGKELVARLIHLLSPRAKQKFVSMNCAAIPQDLMESELFGFEKGAFTGANMTKIGKFEYANNGTLFLDEIADMNLVIQSKVLRVLEQKEFERIGSNTTIYSDVRIISASNKILTEEVKNKRFREDLFYRLNSFPISVPPLRERLDDIFPLVVYMLSNLNQKIGRKIQSFEMLAITELKNYSWPGNIRELENVVTQSVLYTRGNILLGDTVAAVLNQSQSGQSVSAKSAVTQPEDNSDIISLIELEKHAIVRAVQVMNGNLSAAARKLGISRVTLWRKMEKFKIKNQEVVEGT